MIQMMTIDGDNPLPPMPFFIHGCLPMLYGAFQSTFFGEPNLLLPDTCPEVPTSTNTRQCHPVQRCLQGMKGQCNSLRIFFLFPIVTSSYVCGSIYIQNGCALLYSAIYRNRIQLLYS